MCTSVIYGKYSFVWWVCVYRHLIDKFMTIWLENRQDTINFCIWDKISTTQRILTSLSQSKYVNFTKLRITTLFYVKILLGQNQYCLFYISRDPLMLDTRSVLLLQELLFWSGTVFGVSQIFMVAFWYLPLYVNIFLEN